MPNDIIDWLMDDSNPAIKYRTQTELLDMQIDRSTTKKWIYDKLPANWYEVNGLWYRYYITALAECGLSCEDINRGQLDKAFKELETMFDCGCGDFMLLTALVKLGFIENDIVQNIISGLDFMQLPDGGFLCLHRKNKLKYIPKSCYKANLHALMFLAECHKKGVNPSFGEQLIKNFFSRNLFYKTADRSTLVLNCREGWRTIDPFYPFEVMRVGLQNVIESFSALGYGNDARLIEAWNILNTHKDDTNKILLKGTLTKSYLPKERVGKPSKWVTFYTLLAEKHCAI